MSALREQAIATLRAVIADAGAVIEAGLRINNAIHAGRLPKSFAVDLVPIFNMRCAAAEQLAAMKRREGAQRVAA